MLTVNKIKQRIKWAKKKMARNEPIMNAPQQTPGPFVTGRSNYTMGKKLDRENERRAKAFSEYQQGKQDLAHWEERLKLVEAGELHPNGQPRVDAPSRKKQASAKELLAEYCRVTIKPGDVMAIAFNPQNTITVKRVNKKTITAESDTKWEFDELIPMKDGVPMSPEERRAAFNAWYKSQENIN